MIFKKSKKIGQLIGHKTLEDAKKEIRKIIK
jgi:hypothetical protein